MKKFLLSLVSILLTIVLTLTSLTSNVYAKTKKINSVSEFKAYAEANYSKPLKKWSNPIPGALFGAKRSNGRLHSGIDFFVYKGQGQPVYAMTSGKVIEYVKEFYGGTSAVAVQNDDGTVLRYCEIDVNKELQKKGARVTQGQVIGKLKNNNVTHDAMLHLEAYLGTTSGSLSQNKNTTNYKYVKAGGHYKRSDLVDPTFLMYNVKREAGSKAISGITISKGSYSPGSLKKGCFYSLKGIISSSEKIQSVEILVINESNNKTILRAIDSSIDNYTYDINKKLDAKVKFNNLNVGTYSLKIIVNTKLKCSLLVNNKFKVVR